MIVALLCVPLLFAFLSPPHFAHLPPATYYYNSFSKMTENVVRERVISLYHIVTGEVEGPKKRCGLVMADKADWSDELCHFFGELALATEIGPGLRSSLLDVYKVRHISHPHPFMLSARAYGFFPNFEDGWKIDLCLEPDRRIKSPLPHIMLTASQPAQAREGSILYGELAVIVSVMHDRAIQPEVGSEEEMKKLSRMDLEELDEVVGEKAPAFPNEQKFPLLLLSLVNPRHARILCAYMSDDLLVVETSKIYSFEEKESAPIGLFLSWLFASPSPVVET
ncbi:hypothetical protein BO83DRAFT_413425 [Aspergillus eucalypticola CBS 122712]|uniref:HNH nuclease domain-containing protein n=1 Tax=Aspergillus eucalypticola (strain CBS 122712 / IBT 29274) TaxID=1448314 RepID=A0A317WIY7_ASPEC|nr:uncharacterized protein BO83DRAFT_413425 [Aspergillus eucalypticola CBS 122712]PWY85611.1 hypothetical protein BO83DRAFT_413425 [Aspergillus eucalypticola CBS 122712]